MQKILLPTPKVGHAIATERDASFVLDLQKKFSDALGFLPAAAVRNYVESGRVLIGKENDDHAGYVLGRGALRYDPRIAPITQAAVRMDARASIRPSPGSSRKNGSPASQWGPQ